ncbi:MAG: D-alanine--D-alanine ligase [Thermoanaerobaculales bacterium]|nr:D-alanine--D-alanine ligase [Thermoanaerobaculales bacterium]
MRIALIFGGRSAEHDVSVVSARSVSRALSAGGHEVFPMAIDRRGMWVDQGKAQRILQESGDRTDEVVEFQGRHRLDPRFLSETFDVAFPVLHGPYGEDGAIQGLFEMLDLPYVGCDVTASAVCMDKLQTKRLLVQAGFETAPWVTVRRHEWYANVAPLRRRILEFGLPVFVKPTRLGSSLGISKVKNPGELDDAMKVGFDFGPCLIVERGLDAREIEVAVLGNVEPRASLPGEIIPGRDFYDYKDKYLDDGCRLLAPAPLDEELVARVRKLAVDVFRLLGCEGMARVDLFLEGHTERLWVNEVNSIPGFTSISMYPRLWDLSGVKYPALLDELLRLAVERHRQIRKQG